MSGDQKNILDTAIHRIVKKFQPRKIILFGSYAEGKPGPDSDIDLLIILDVKGSTRQAANEIDMLLSDRRTPMDFIVLTPEQYGHQKSVIGTLVYNIEQTGKVVYEPAA